jgi:hypothetical protein
MTFAAALLFDKQRSGGASPPVASTRPPFARDALLSHVASIRLAIPVGVTSRLATEAKCAFRPRHLSDS